MTASARLRAAPSEQAWPSVALLEADLELARSLGDRAATGSYDVAVPVRTVARGRWTPSRELRQTLGLLVIDGLILRSVNREGLDCFVLYGPGDLIDMHQRAFHESWIVRRPAKVAAYDGHLVTRAREHPPLLVTLLRRMQAGQRESELMAAIARKTRVNNRLLSLLRHFGSRWGEVTTSGILVDLPLTHLELGRLIGARRPTVTIAVAQLAEEGLLTRDKVGRWIVQPDSASGE